MAWKVHRNGFGTTTDTRVERMNTSVGTAVPAKRVGLASERVFLGTSALLFMASAGATIYWSGSMSSNRLMSKSGSMSIAWMGTLGQTWLSAAASFMAMWVVMMVAMMLPSLVPTLLIYRRSLHAVHRPDKTHLGGLTALAGTGYFFVWAVFGTAVYPLGVALTTAEMQWMALANLVPIATGVVLLVAGCFQQAWVEDLNTFLKVLRHLSRFAPGRSKTPEAQRSGAGIRNNINWTPAFASVTPSTPFRTIYWNVLSALWAWLIGRTNGAECRGYRQVV